MLAALINASRFARSTGRAIDSNIYQNANRNNGINTYDAGHCNISFSISREATFIDEECIPYFYKHLPSPTSHDFITAFRNASEMTVGWTPVDNNSMHFFNSAPQSTTTDVVPSPATTSLPTQTPLLCQGPNMAFDL